MNLYAYVGGNPVNWIDPRGLITGMEALEHYETGNGTPLKMNFSEIDTSSVNLMTFDGFYAELNSIRGQETEKTINLKMDFSTKGELSTVLGRIVLRLIGTLKSTCSYWEFDGALRAYDALYSFNKSNRDPFSELLTEIARDNIVGTPYYIEIEGERKIYDSRLWLLTP